ncbi:MAG: UDP-N-acetylmuramate dehydrogenase [Abditibacteriota bacterium]|nr:UDP-N-acetylmuramate dehydrogenase [Abditibacteriota bacterium]
MNAVWESTQSTLESLASFAQQNELLSRHTTMRVGGPAKFWAEPQSEAELEATLRAVKSAGAPLKVLGAGSNLVANDAGFEGVVLHLGNRFSWQRVHDNLLVCGGAALLPKLTHFALKNNLGNFEWACGIPGTVGGSLWGNAGARGFNGREWESRDAAADFHSLVAYDREGARHELQRGDVEFAYRRSSIGELIVTEATFALKPLSDEEAARHREAVKELLQKRRDSQPVSAASAGCIWKNPKAPDCRGAGELIERLGLKSRRVGGAQVSAVHGNFIVNDGSARANDILQLMSEIESEVLRQSGIQLEREVRFLD